MPASRSAEGRLGSAAAGAFDVLPLAASAAPIGLLFGSLAAQKGLSALETLLMSALVFAGSAQFVALDLWRTPLPVAALVAATLMINLRHLLMSAALTPHLAGVAPARAYAALFFLADEIWALALRRATRGGLDLAYYLGAALLFYVVWVAAGGLGALLGGLLSDPARWGLDFAFPALFLALLAGFWRGRASARVWAASAAAALLGYLLLDGIWYVLLGGLAGTLAGALSGAPPRDT